MSVVLRTSGLLLLVGSAAAARARVARVVAVAAGVVVGAAVQVVEVGALVAARVVAAVGVVARVVAAVGVVAGVGALVAAVVEAVGLATVAAVGVVVVGLELLRVERGVSGGSGSCPYVIRTGDRAGETCGKPHFQHRCFSRLDHAWRAKFGDESERPCWAELLRSGVAIFDLDYDAILAAMYALSVSAEGDCYLSVPPDPGIEADALGSSASALPGTEPSKALHTFTLDSGRHLATFTRRPGSSLYTLATEPPQVAASSQVFASGPVAPPCSCRFLSHQTLLWHHRLGHLSLPRLRGMHSHLLVFGPPRSSPPALSYPALPSLRRGAAARRSSVLLVSPDDCSPADSPHGRVGPRALLSAGPSCHASTQVSASGLVAPPCSCCLLSHQTLLWHHRLGHPSLPRLRGMQSRLLVSGLPRSLPPLLPSPPPPCLPCLEWWQHAAPHSSSFPPTTAPVQTLHMDVWGPARISGQDRERYFLLVVDDYTRYTTVFPLCSKGEVLDVLIPWIRAVRLQLCERLDTDLRVLRLHSDRGGEFASDLLRDICRGEGMRSFTLLTSSQQNGVA
ncbi:unnamed protein product [Closterium sp. NIES-53]